MGRGQRRAGCKQILPSHAEYFTAAHQGPKSEAAAAPPLPPSALPGAPRQEMISRGWGGHGGEQLQTRPKNSGQMVSFWDKRRAAGPTQGSSVGWEARPLHLWGTS